MTLTVATAAAAVAARLADSLCFATLPQFIIIGDSGTGKVGDTRAREMRRERMRRNVHRCVV